MSGGTPVGNVRQRHSQGFSFASSSDDLEDDACSRVRPPAPSSPRGWTKVEIVENILWLVSATFIVYYGDGYSNLFYLLLYDDRIQRYKIFLDCSKLTLFFLLVMVFCLFILCKQYMLIHGFEECW